MFRKELRCSASDLSSLCKRCQAVSTFQLNSLLKGSLQLFCTLPFLPRLVYVIQTLKKPPNCLGNVSGSITDLTQLRVMFLNACYLYRAMEKSWLRYAAAACILKICCCPTYADVLAHEQFQKLAQVMQVS